MGWEIAFSGLVVFVFSFVAAWLVDDHQGDSIVTKFAESVVVVSFCAIPIGLVMAIWQ